MTTLYLDLGTTIGWCKEYTPSVEVTVDPYQIQSHAKVKVSANILSGAFCCGALKKQDSNIRYGNFDAWLRDNLVGVTAVYYEQVRRHMSCDSAHVFGGLAAILFMNCIKRNIPYFGEGVKTIKKVVTGNGNADKDMMIAAVKKLGYEPVDNNEADAIGLYLTVRSMSAMAHPNLSVVKQLSFV